MAEAKRKLAAILAADVVGYSRLMAADERATMDMLDGSRAVFRDNVSSRAGRVVDTAGDSVLAVFDSVVEAVECAAQVQSQLAERNAEFGDDRKMLYRIGVNLGDVFEQPDGTVYGDGVNVAARLEGLASPGGICLSGSAHEQVVGKIDLGFENIGEQQVKNIARPVQVYRVRLSETSEPNAKSHGDHQEVRFCTAPDGVSIGYALTGSGPPLVKSANWLNHLEYDWSSPIWRHLLVELGRDHKLIRYDERGNGLSDWDAEDISFDAFVSDLETVVDACGLEKFPLLGISQGCAVSIAFAVRHPDRVSKLILYGGFARGRNKRGSQADADDAEAMTTLIRHFWGKDNPAIRQLFATMFVPDGTATQIDWFNDLQRITTSPETAVRIRRAVNDIDVTDLLGQVTTPTLVLHCRGDAMVPFEEGRRMAAAIPGANFVALEGRNHLILEDEPAWPRFIEEVRSFLESQ